MLRAGAPTDVIDFDVPAPAFVTRDVANTITASGAFADLPDPCRVDLVNPHPTAPLLVLVHYGANLTATGVAVRIGVRVSGSTVLTPFNVTPGWGLMPRANPGANGDQYMGFGHATLPASSTPATFDFQAIRDAASGSQTVTRPTIMLTPLRFLFT